jgi:hypothetical protein
MQFDLQNRYFRVAILWLFMSIGLWIVLHFILALISAPLPLWMELVVASLAAGYLINVFFLNRLG